MNLKELLGSNYKDGITVAEIDAVLSSKKLVDLDGDIKYVVKDKFDKLNSELEKYKGEDIEAIKKERDSLKAESQRNKDYSIFSKAKVDDKFKDDIGYRLEKGTIQRGKTDEETQQNIEAFLKTNPQYAVAETGKKPDIRFVSNDVNKQSETTPASDNSSINDILRGAFSQK